MDACDGGCKDVDTLGCVLKWMWMCATRDADACDWDAKMWKRWDVCHEGCGCVRRGMWMRATVGGMRATGDASDQKDA